MSNGIVFVPGSTAHIPVGKPHLFGLHILLLKVEDTGVSNEGIEAFFVVTGQPIYREGTEAGTYSTHFAYKRLGLDIVGCCEVVAHTLATIVFTDLFQPLLTKTGQSMTVGSYNDIALCGNQLQVPTIRPELAYGALRTTLTVEYGGIFLVGIEVGRIYYPRKHLLAIGSGYPAFLYVAHLYLGKHIVILVRQVGSLACVEVYYIYFIGARD